MRRWIATTALIVLALGLIALLIWHWPRAKPDAARDTRQANATTKSGAAADEPAANTHSHGQPHPSPGQTALPQKNAADARCHQDRQAQYRLMRARIDPRASPGDAVAHIQLARLLEDPQLDTTGLWQETERALERWPDDVELAWLAFELCNDRNGCNPANMRKHLERADAQNLYAWLPALAEAYQRKDARAFKSVLHRAAGTGITDSRIGTVYLRMRPVLGSVPIPQGCAKASGMVELAATLGRPTVDTALVADMEATAMDVATAFPALSGLQGCSKRGLPSSVSVTRDCRRVLARLAQQDTLLEQGLALPSLIELATDDSSRGTWREQYLRLLWLRTISEDAARAKGVMWNMWMKGEVTTLEQYARDTGRWPPPAGWVPDGARSRELLGLDAP